MGIQRRHHGIQRRLHQFSRRHGAGLGVQIAHPFDGGVDELGVRDLAHVAEADAFEGVAKLLEPPVLAGVGRIGVVDLPEALQFADRVLGKGDILAAEDVENVAERRFLGAAPDQRRRHRRARGKGKG